jgi:hypothetical protein
MNAANNPRAAPDQAAAVRQWAETHGCEYCNNSGWVSGLRWRWIEFRSVWEQFRATGRLDSW